MDNPTGKLFCEQGTNILFLRAIAHQKKSRIHPVPQYISKGGGKKIHPLQMYQSTHIAYHLMMVRPAQMRADRGRAWLEEVHINSDRKFRCMITEELTDPEKAVTVRTHGMYCA
jgi:hypothetical protein